MEGRRGLGWEEGKGRDEVREFVTVRILMVKSDECTYV